MCFKVVINSFCKLCYNCVEVCPSQAIVELKDLLYIDDWACVSCHICYQVCPEDAIKITDLFLDSE